MLYFGNLFTLYVLNFRSSNNKKSCLLQTASPRTRKRITKFQLDKFSQENSYSLVTAE